MILESVRLHPFAGTADRKILLKAGLNVIAGPNEAGKSSLVNALKRVLFTPTNLTPARFRTEMQAYLPIAGGDTVRVSITFRNADGRYLLEKCWSPGRGSSSRLCLPSGGELTTPEQVDAALRQLLTFTEGTYHNVLITYQSHLSGTMTELRKDPVRTTASLAELLRRSIFQSDGVPVDRLRELAGERTRQYFSRWDRERQKPEGGRDIDRPWKQDVGVVLDAYYTMRLADQAFRQADEVDRKIDECAGRIRTLQQETTALSAYVESYAQHYTDARRRSEIDSRIQLLRKDLADMREASQQWPVAEEQAGRLRTEVPALREQLKALRAEKRQTEEYAARQALLETYREATHAQRRLEEEETRLAQMPQIDDRVLAALREAEGRVSRLRVRLESRKLALRIAAVKPFSAALRTPEGERIVELEPGTELNTTVGGSLELIHPHWSLRLQPAGDDERTLSEELERETAGLHRLQQSLGADSSEEAASLLKAWTTQQAAVGRARAALEALTRKEPYEALARRIADLPPLSPGRDGAVLDQLMDAVTAEGTQKMADLKAVELRCETWKRRYTDPQRLLDLLLEQTDEEKHLAREIAALKPLPEGATGPAAFMKTYDEKRNALAGKKDQLRDLEIERARIEKDAPRESRDELKERFENGRRAYQTALAHGAAYARVHGELEGLFERLDRATFEPLRVRFEALVRRLTLERYSGLEMEGPVPVKVRGLEQPLEIGLLSQGTLDVLALAVRLGMAEYYLGESDGFVVMDDPLVNLDPERQSAAAGCLREFAATKQTIVLTCHPSHAGLLGGQIIQL